jgi:2-isopropylmalate synthase
VQRRTDTAGGEVSSAELWDIFRDEYLPSADPALAWGRFSLRGIRQTSDADRADHLSIDVVDGDQQLTLEGHGNGPIAAFVNALAGLDVDVRVLDYAEHAMSSGGDATAAAYLECAVGDRVLWGVGVDPNIVRASLKAVISAVNRAHRDDTASA